VTTPLQKFEAFMDEALVKSLTDLTLERTAPASESAELLRARLCFDGAGMKAQAFISCSMAFLQSTCPLPLTTSEHSHAVIKDWLGELGNLILGRLKNRLLAHDITIKISAPSFDGNWQKPTPSQTLEIWFQNQTAAAVIGFDCTIEGVIPDIGEPVKQTAEILPGDAIYRLNDPFHSKGSYDIISKIRSGIQQGDDTSARPEPDYMEDEDDFDEQESPGFGDIQGRRGRDVRADSQRSENETTTAETMKSPAPEARSSDAANDSTARVVPKPIRILFHSQPQLPVLSSLTWSQIDKLVLHFNSGLEYSICPSTLLDRGATSFEVEGVLITFQRDGELMRVSIPKYNMHLNKHARVA